MATKRMKNHDLEKQYKREWYYRNRQKVILQINERKAEIKEWFRGYKSTLKCSRCGFSHPAAIQFHHTDPAMKDGGISFMVAQGQSKERILAEIAKCEVLCANCHAIEHFGNSWEVSPEGVEPSQADLEDLPSDPLMGTSSPYL